MSLSHSNSVISAFDVIKGEEVGSEVTGRCKRMTFKKVTNRYFTAF
jgi:hypothetical protein